MPGSVSVIGPAPYQNRLIAVSEAIWDGFRDVEHYVEPMPTLLDVLLRRPHLANRQYYSETINDPDGIIVNLWRSLIMSRDELAERVVALTPLPADRYHAMLADWIADDPIMRIRGSIAWHRVDVAAATVHAMLAWTRAHHCAIRPAGQIGDVVEPQPPFFSDMAVAATWLAYLVARLRHMRIHAGDWARTLTPAAIKTLSTRNAGHAGVLIAPPLRYTLNARGTRYIARATGPDTEGLVGWAAANGDDPELRIAVVLPDDDTQHGPGLSAAGYWQAVTGDGLTVWLSPNCARQSRLF